MPDEVQVHARPPRIGLVVTGGGSSGDIRGALAAASIDMLDAVTAVTYR